MQFFLLFFLSLTPVTGFHSGQDLYELRGQVLLPGDKLIPGDPPLVALEGTRSIFFDRTFAGLDGKFRFEDLKEGAYQLVVSAPGWGSLRTTVLIGPGQADSKNRVEKIYYLEPETSPDATISATDLSIPEKAAREYRKALEALRKEQREQAILFLERAIEIAPHYAGAWNRLGTIYYKSGRLQKAEEHFQKAVEHDPTAYPQVVNLGAVYLAQGELEKALQLNQRAAEWRPDDPLARSQLGCTFFALGDFHRAEHELLMAKTLDSEHFSNPQLVLAEIYRQRKEYGKLIVELEEFLKTHPSFPKREGLEHVLEAARLKLSYSDR